MPNPTSATPRHAIERNLAASLLMTLGEPVDDVPARLAAYEPSDDATERARHSADRVFDAAGLVRDGSEDADDAYTSLLTWFTQNDDELQSMARGEDDGCPCEECSAAFGR